MTIYLLDTNAISDLITNHPNFARRTAERLIVGDSLGLSRPIDYEVLRGLYWRNAMNKLKVYLQDVVPILTWYELIDDDWQQAARFWADAHRKGKQLGDPDLLLAALAYRVGGIVVSADADFDALPVSREDWRLS